MQNFEEYILKSSSDSTHYYLHTVQDSKKFNNCISKNFYKYLRYRSYCKKTDQVIVYDIYKDRIVINIISSRTTEIPDFKDDELQIFKSCIDYADRDVFLISYSHNTKLFRMHKKEIMPIIEIPNTDKINILYEFVKL